jgi:hypothetical protein
MTELEKLKLKSNQRVEKKKIPKIPHVEGRGGGIWRGGHLLVEGGSPDLGEGGPKGEKTT